MGDWLLRILKGALIGVGAILPGISGGVLMVVLGIYRPVMAFLAHPLKAFKRHFSLLLPVLLGWAIGVVGLSRIVSWLFRTSAVPAIWLFVGLVVGTLPSLYKEAGSRGRPRSAWLWLVVGAALMGAWMWLISRGQGMHVTPNAWWWIFCGVLWGLGLIVPGMSPSSFFIFFSLYEPMTDGISRLDPAVVLPMALGLAATVALLARGMNALLKRAHTQLMHAILGIVAASTIAILPLGPVNGFGDVAAYAGCFLAGCGVAFGMEKMSAKLRPGKDAAITEPAQIPRGME